MNLVYMEYGPKFLQDGKHKTILRVWLRLVASRSQAKSVRGPAVRGYVRTLNLGHLPNSVIEQELLGWRVENRTNAISPA